MVLHNKLDIVNENKCCEHFKIMTKFLNKIIAKNAPIIPISAQLNYNIDKVLEYLTSINDNKKDVKSPAIMNIIRSFDINKPGILVNEIKGGIIGGSIRRGVFSVNDIIEIKPGLLFQSQNQIYTIPLITRITSLYSDNNKLDYAIPGGLIAIGTNLDPNLTKSNSLTGNIVGHIGTLPDMYSELLITFEHIDREDYDKSKFEKNEIVALFANSKINKCVVINSKKKKYI